MIRMLMFLLLIPCASSFGYDGPPLVDNSDEIEIHDAIRKVVKSFDDEDLSSYESCFKRSRRKPVRRQAAMLFAWDECHMELVDAHLIGVEGDSAFVAVKYRMGGSDSSFEFLSELHMLKEDGSWVIEKESVRSSSALRAPSRHASRGAPQKPKGEWDPYNPDPSMISPNLHDLIGDIGIQPGFGCAGGNCAGGRCNK